MSSDISRKEKYTLNDFSSDFFREVGLSYEKMRRNYQEDSIDRDKLENLAEVMGKFFDKYRNAEAMLEETLENNVHPLELENHVMEKSIETRIP